MASEDDVDLQTSQRRVASTALEVLQAKRKLEELVRDVRAIERSKVSRLRSLWSVLRSLVGKGPPSLPIVEDPIESANRFANVILRAFEIPEVRAIVASFELIVARRQTATPLVSIVIPGVDQVASTLRCLQSIADAWVDSFSLEIIVIDDASSDESTRVLGLIPGIFVIKNTERLGTVLSANLGIARACGRYVYFLKNDTVVTDGWLDALVEIAESDSSIGAVGSKIVYPDNRLQEAGTIVWRDGTNWKYGRFDDPDDPRYNFRRDVDACSGASLLVRAKVLMDLGGFDRRFAAVGYYDDVDLCMAIRHLGHRVIYQPASAVVRSEDASSDTSLASSLKRPPTVGAALFEEKWHDVLLRDHLESQAKSVYTAARRLHGTPRVLVIEGHVPKHDRDAGSLRLTRIMQSLLAAGTRVVFFPVDLAPVQPYTRELQRAGIEVICQPLGAMDVGLRLATVLTEIDMVWICRPEVAERFQPLLRRFPNLKIVYDTIDLHFVRKRRQAELTGGAVGADWGTDRIREIACARSADATITVTETERGVLESFAIAPIYVVPTVHSRRVTVPPTYDETSDLVFIGGYDHPPNVDAVQWFVREIMPLVWRRLPSLCVTLLGSNPPASVRDLTGPKITVPGFLPNVDPYFRKHRIFVAPLRYGAGLKGKIGESLSYGLPIVATPVAAEGFDFIDGIDALIASDAASFADAIVRLYGDRKLWESIALKSLTTVEKFSPEAIGQVLQTIVRDVLALPISRRSDPIAFDLGMAPRRIVIASAFRAGASYCSETIGKYLETEPAPIAFDRYAEHNLHDELLAQLHGIEFVIDLQMRPHSKNLNACRDESIGVTILWRNLADAVVSFDNNTSRYGANNAIFYVDHQALVALSVQNRYRYIIDSIVLWNIGFYLNWRRIPGSEMHPYESLLDDSFTFFRSMLLKLGFPVDDRRLESIVKDSNTNVNIDVVAPNNPLDETNRRRIERVVLDHPERDQLEVLIWELPWEPLELERRSAFDGRTVQGADADVFFVSSGVRRKVDASWLASRVPRFEGPRVISNIELNALPRGDDLY